MRVSISMGFTFEYLGSYAGTVIALPLSGAIAHGIGWPWVFYIFGKQCLPVMLIDNV